MTGRVQCQNIECLRYANQLKCFSDSYETCKHYGKIAHALTQEKLDDLRRLDGVLLVEDLGR